ncbi:hypothetical protein ABT144_29500 [Streptomyces sp. NPDC002039]|uniref:hypothetical protein n=1 Tax=Streptomyces sp. NPDC002039 TaxID=3154660 RepID=UPI003327BE51
MKRQTGGDAVHYFSTPPPTISAHGWWLDKDSGGAKAEVTVGLQILTGGRRHTVATGSKTVRQGGGSSRRANARKTCVGTKATTWRSRVDVDIIGVADSSNKLEPLGKTFNCGVRGRRTMREESPVLTAEIYGVLTRHPWIGQVSADHDLDEDLFSLAVKRAGAYGWSTTLLGAQNTLGGQRWEHADAGGDWSQDGQEHRVAWVVHEFR